MALSKDFERLKGGCPWLPYCTKQGITKDGECKIKHCAVLYWLKHAFIDSNPGDVEF